MTGRRLAETRRAWHGVAELLLAGPQYRRSGTIRLRVVPGGFATVKEPEVRVEGAELIAGGQRLALPGNTPAGLAAALDVDAGVPDIYDDHSGVREDEALVVEPEIAAYLGAWFTTGDAALRRLFPDQTPVLWPEHFDVSVTENEVNYGISPGDAWHNEPYAYVGPWTPRQGEFWNAPFGAARSMVELPGPTAIAEFFDEGRAKL
ncbi:hypothetical protein O7635_20285 [Asanoa sp. WMMD1127]|uniref:hypothetical protein n=1 Tax=Asanoa sp. WMMD1127 TaxID=3016107 RepID=UPI002417A4CF|nr:hypothetical protein [Asanoa sp. WMMD1127]MDG4824195.1 hypothetical protein [Asanoa sp. WMMD1127]